MKLKDFKEINYFVSTTKDGNLDFRFDDSEMVIKNRREFFRKTGLKMEEAVCMNVANHKDDILFVGEKDLKKGMFKLEDAPLVDAMITHNHGISLMLLIADCLPMAMYDPKKKVVALVHLSRETTFLKLAKKVIGLLKEKFNSDPKDLMAEFGPHIFKESYVMDLAGENLNQLLKEGVLEENITISKENTYTSSKYFSFHRSEEGGEKQGRFATVLGMAK